MLNILNPWKPAAIVLAALTFSLLLWGWRVDSLRAHYAKEYSTLSKQSSDVLKATQSASDNPQLKWTEVASQISELGTSNARLKNSFEVQNRTIADMAAQSVALKAKASDLAKIAAQAQQQREWALSELATYSTTPGSRDNAAKLLAEANAALDIIRKAGL